MNIEKIKLKWQKLAKWSQEGLHWLVLLAIAWFLTTSALAAAAILYEILSSPLVWSGIIAIVVALLLNGAEIKLFDDDNC